MKAYSESTGNTYEDWEALVAAESNGYVVTAIITKGKQSWPWTIGPFDTKREASLARNRLRNRMKRENAVPWYADRSFRLFIRPAWKDVRT